MIHYLTRAHVDLEKYDNCITNAINSRIYAYSWYLDIVADKNWDVLVLDDYTAVMPLPKRRKYFINYVYLPSWCQQLGVFSKKTIEEFTINEFLGRIPKRFKLVDIYFNSQNRFSSKYLSIRNNYILSLDKTYDSIFSNYRKDRKKSLKKAAKNELYFDSEDQIEELIGLYKEVFPKLSIGDKSFDTLCKLIEFCRGSNYGFQRNIYKSDTIVARGFFLHIDNRIYYLFGASSKEGKKAGATVFMIDSVIKEFIETKTIFDFEGSSIPSIGSFYKSFGPEKEEYLHYKKHRFL